MSLTHRVSAENWDIKGKFPPSLKPLLGQVALKAVILGEYDENFFNLMPRLFPYNKFTMTVCNMSHPLSVGTLSRPRYHRTRVFSTVLFLV